jgi:MFS family permease
MRRLLAYASKHKKPLLWLFLGTGASLWLSARDPGVTAFYIAVGILIYALCLKYSPATARVVLAVGGAFSGMMIVGGIILSVIFPFRDGYSMLGPAIIGGLISMVVGSILGFWIVGLLTEPPGNDADTENLTRP